MWRLAPVENGLGLRSAVVRYLGTETRKIGYIGFAVFEGAVQLYRQFHLRSSAEQTQIGHGICLRISNPAKAPICASAIAAVVLANFISCAVEEIVAKAIL